MSYVDEILIGALVVINVTAFLVMANDKRKAVKGRNSNRTPEVLVFFMAAAFGAIGVYLGMHTFRHKTRRWHFQIGIPLLIMQNLAFVYLVSMFV